ncbi:MAG TPA: XRE family transcriptional regulator [Kiritimatiellia bacterium]|nr:XRE family transcriptional regulator [Kiritimatiellia bacterium]HMO99361.1 XRE family transcriptional regulator [Kiritimatiellia bacterium]HMP95652.1 XRE family transcriptional regulator [Kiritimatiellia bacterium]
MNIGARIRQARRMLGLSYRDVATRTGGQVSHTAIAKYEKGVMSPGSTALLALAGALDQPIDFFFRPPLVSFTKPPRFRKKTGLSQKEQESILESASDYLERYYEVEDLSSSRLDYAAPWPTKIVRSPQEAMRMAKELRQEWNLGCDPLPNVHELMELKGIKVCEVKSENPSFDGLCTRTSRGPVVVLASWLNKNLPRKRMTEIHELSHVVLKVPEEITEREEENLAWSFAGELLLPEESFIDAFGKKRTSLSVEELVDLKMLFGASIMAIVYRAKVLKLIDDALFKAFWKYANANHWRTKGEPGDDTYRGNESYSRFRQLVIQSILEEKISLSKGAALLHLSLDELRRDLGAPIRG